mmetsp:Transcript_32501/g.82160  ORF Transcript_32501/g.82160 Transcript_32501/m.82160 type:complete len:254 (+) Transcript_32501:903-1664(+)
MLACNMGTFSRAASCTCCRLARKSFKKSESVCEARIVRQRKCSVDTAPVLKVPKELREARSKPRAPSLPSSTPWLMKFPRRNTTLSNSRNSVLARTSSAAELSTLQRCSWPPYSDACDKAKRMSLKRPTLRGKVQKGITFCSTSRSCSTAFLCSSSFFDSSAVGSTVTSNSKSSMLSKELPKSNSWRHVHNSSEETFNLLSTIAMFCARVASSTQMPCGFRVIALRLAPTLLVPSSPLENMIFKSSVSNSVLL